MFKSMGVKLIFAVGHYFSDLHICISELINVLALISSIKLFTHKNSHLLPPTGLYATKSHKHRSGMIQTVERLILVTFLY